MSKTVKLNQRAFNRGVDEVLLLKPLRRAMFALIKRLYSFYRIDLSRVWNRFPE